MNIGTVSCGTLITSDLISSFCDELESQVKAAAPHPGAMNPDQMNLIRECGEWLDTDEDERDEEIGAELVNDLIDALSEYAPPYFYFGAHPGDGADFGYWLGEDDLNRAVRDNGGLCVDDLSEVPADYVGEVLHVNDHGNASLYSADNGKLTEIWAVV